MFRVIVYLQDNTVITYEVATEHQSREHAKRIVTEGFQWDCGDGLTFYPVSWVFKVKLPDNKIGRQYPMDKQEIGR